MAHVIGVVSTYAVPGQPEQVRLLQRPIIRGTGQPRCELGYCQGSRVGQPEKGADVSGCLLERADVCLTNGWLRSIVFQAAVVIEYKQRQTSVSAIQPATQQDNATAM